MLLPRSTSPRRLALTLGATVAAVLGAGVPVASAGVVSLEAGQLVYRATPGQSTYMSVLEGWDGSVMLADDERPEIAAGTPCEVFDRTPDNMVECQAQAPGNDTVDGGAGVDLLSGNPGRRPPARRR